MYCIHCGASMKESASFCMKCGKANTLLKQSVDTADLQATAQAATQESAQAAALATPQATALPVIQQKWSQRTGRPCLEPEFHSKNYF